MSARPGTPTVLHVRFHPPGGELDPADYEVLLDLLEAITPVVQALPPTAALLDISGTLPYFHTDVAGLAAMIRARALATHATDTTTAAASNPLLAHLAARTQPAGALRVLTDDQVAGFLAPLPPTVLPGIGAAAARTLTQLGLTTLGRIAATPLPTLQRALGTGPGTRLHQHARGIDPTPLTPARPEPALTAEHTFPADELDPDRQRAALLHLAHHLGTALRTRGQAAGTLTLTARYANRTSTTRTRRPTQPTDHTPDLTDTAYRLHHTLGLQRARVRTLILRAGELLPAAAAHRQLTLDPAPDRDRMREAAADRARHRFGPTALTPATLLPFRIGR
ncbi:DinB/UmuC family translesion DNA polymerase [Kitasatospora cineracea]